MQISNNSGEIYFSVIVKKYVKYDWSKWMKEYTVSKYLVRKSINDDYDFIYNSLYINSRIISHDLYAAINLIKGKSVQECKELLGEDVFVELQQNNFIVECGQDERSQLKNELLERKEKLESGCFFQRMHLSTTNKCNMNCEYCFCNQFEYSGGDLRFPSEKMEFDVADKAITEAINVIKKNNNTSLSIEFFGGEPLLNHQLIISVLEKYGNGENYGLEITYGCTTNGAFVADELLPYLKKYNVRVAISIDYIDYEHNTFRGAGTSNIKWDQIDKNICKLSNQGIELKFQSVLSEQTWDKYNFNLIDYAAEKHIKAVGIILSFDFEFYKKYSPKLIAAKVLEVNDYCKSKNIQLSGYWYLSFLGLIYPEQWNQRRDWKTCPTIGRLLSIEPNGDVYACKTTAKKMGNVNHFMDIFKNENYQYYAMRAYSNSDECDGCEFEGVCSGNCAGAVEDKYKDISRTNKEYCETVKEILNGLLTRYLKEIDIDQLIFQEGEGIESYE